MIKNGPQQQYTILICEIVQYYSSHPYPVFPVDSYVKLQQLFFNKGNYKNKYQDQIECLEYMMKDDLPRLREANRIKTINNILNS